MGTDVLEVGEKLPSPSDIKVHRLMCTELTKLVEKVDKKFPEIEAARPRCSSGITSLCQLTGAIGKAKALLRDCCELSKLYLALTGNTILSRCKNSKNTLEQSLSQIQNMVPVLFASEISRIIADLRAVTFSLDPSEEEAGKAVRALLELYKSGDRVPAKDAGHKYIHIAALKLQITSQKALLVERRSIKKLLNKISEKDGSHTKKQILFFLLDTLIKYANSITSIQLENENIVQDQESQSRKVDLCVDHEEASCGAPTDELTQLSADASSWENSSSSINSLSISMNNLLLPVDYSNVSLGSLDNTLELDSELTRELDDSLPWEFQCKNVEDLMTRLKRDNHDREMVSFESLVGSVVGFLKVSRDMNDVKAQGLGCLLLLMLITKYRSERYLNTDAYRLIAEFLESQVSEEALAIIEALSSHRNCQLAIIDSDLLTHIFKILGTQVRQLQTLALKILYNLTSTQNIHPLVSSSALIQKLVPLFEDDSLSTYCMAILGNLCAKQDNRRAIAETEGCVSFVAKVLENEGCEAQEQALDILLSLCSQSVEYCRLVMHEGVIPTVVSVSINGNNKGKAKAHEMLWVLREIRDDECVEESSPVTDSAVLKDTNVFCKEKKTSSRASRFLSKLSLVSRGSLARKTRI